MDIGRLIRSPVEAAAPEAKTTELRPGQTVRGVVLQHLPDDEALMNVGGTTVRAKLETPMPVGRPSLFLVMPGDGRLALHLKPISAPAGEIGSETFASILKSFGLQDTALGRAALRALHEAGASLTRAALTAVMGAAAELNPPPAELDGVLRAAAAAVQRGVPVTAQSVSALHAALNGPSLADTLSATASFARAALASGEGGAMARQAAQQLLTLLPQLEDALNGVVGRPQAGGTGGTLPASAAQNASTSPNPASQPGAPAQGAPVPGGEAGTPPPLFTYLKLLGIDAEREWLKLSLSMRPAAQQPGTAGGAAGSGAAPDARFPAGLSASPQSASVPSDSAQHAAGRTGTAQSPSGQAAVPHAAAGQPSASQHGTGQPAVLPQPGSGQSASAQYGTGQSAAMQAGVGQPSVAQPGIVQASASHAANQPAASQHAAGPNAAGAWTTASAAAGMSGASAGAAAGLHMHPSSTASSAGTAGAATAAAFGTASAENAGPASFTAPPSLLQMAGEHPPAAERLPVETLKAVLLQLSAADDAPPALRESAQQALQTITGQQLLMAQDRAAPMAHVMMMIPLKAPGGGQDGQAAVHIHTRRGRRGELDAENCRLWFQLSLASLGETWVDVTVANKLVGIQVWNDRQEARELFQLHKRQMETALEEMGYRLSAFKHSAMPAVKPARSEPEAAASASRLPVSAPTQYRGVDLRI